MKEQGIKKIKTTRRIQTVQMYHLGTQMEKKKTTHLKKTTAMKQKRTVIKV